MVGKLRFYPTFSVGQRSSVIDVTLAQLPAIMSITGWRVRLDLFSDSDHNYIEFIVDTGRQPQSPSSVTGWSRSKLGREKLMTVLRADVAAGLPGAEGNDHTRLVKGLRKYT